ncbi:AMP-binding protein [Saccharothrix sp. HUAS TT1]|uniref:AMP-binding protein n=1 Tax=unclassified Saccharothrix TaxID=2593673 RepID=UPI00345C5C78
MTVATTTLWGGPARPPCLLDSLVTTARAHPDRVAVVDGDRSFTYAGLHGWVGEVVALLRGHGVRSGDRVAVAGARSAEVVAAFLAVAAVGATYVPLDAEYPERRLAHMLADSGASVLLHTGAGPRFGASAVPVPIPRPGPGAAYEVVACSPDLPVYVIYTSGSTGWPKGVAVPHSCLDGMAEWQRTHSPRPDLRTAQFAPLNFDVSFQEVLGTLCGGGTLVIVPEDLRQDPFELLDWLAEHRVERLFLPNVALTMLAVAASAEDSLDHLSLVEVNTAGEQLVCTPPIRELFERLPGCRLTNHYGQSESAMVSSHVLTGPPSSWPALPPIGVPLPGCELLLDPADPDVPDVGELLVAGLPLSLGYLNQPELNERRYVDVPTTPHGHTRAFRTGDLVRFADGVAWFLSRTDHDVKIRGYRVNPLEVDAWLLEQPGVAAAVCVVVEAGEGARSLRAAVTPKAGVELDVPGLLKALEGVLPEHAVPQSITVLPALPRTPSGKVDRELVAKNLAAAL